MGLFHNAAVTSLSKCVKQDKDYTQMKIHISYLFHQRNRKFFLKLAKLFHVFSLFLCLDKTADFTLKAVQADTEK